MSKGSVRIRNEAFGRLLSGMVSSIAAYEGKTTARVEEELGAVLHVSGKTVQRYKTGYLPPDDEAVRYLAEAAVRRAFVGREWLQRFLHAARYPFAEKLLDALCPTPQMRTLPPRVYENLPAPTYSQFVMRERAFAETLDGLQQRNAVVLIVGMGGSGKTSLAREVASHCLGTDGPDAPRFDSAVWISDKDRPGTTNLSLVLDGIARTLNYPGFTQYEHSEKQYEVEQLLRRQRVLVIVDNFETITDGALLAWLLRLPEPSKALVTTREYRREWRSSWSVELRGMREAEAWELMNQRIRMLRLDQFVADQSLLEPLLMATGGNPKAIEMTLGLVKYEGRSLQQVVDDLYAARCDLFDDLFDRSWALLDEAARRVLMVATFFPTSASSEALSASADVQGLAFERAVERLADMALIDVQYADLNSPPRYTLHPLVHVFAKARLKDNHDFELRARERWSNWFIKLTEKVGYCWDDLSRLQILDRDVQSIIAVFNWAEDQQRFEVLIDISKNVEYFFWVRGLWMERRMFLEKHLKIAILIESYSEKLFAISGLIEMYAFQRDINKLGDLIPMADVLEKGIGEISFYRRLYALTFYYQSIGNDSLSHKLIEQSIRDVITEKPAISLCKVYVAAFYYMIGDFEKAKRFFLDGLEYSEKVNYIRNVIFSSIISLKLR